MNLLFIADPLETFKTYKDSTYAMMTEAARRGHAISAMLAGDLVWKAEWVVGRTHPIRLTGDTPWFRCTPLAVRRGALLKPSKLSAALALAAV